MAEKARSALAKTGKRLKPKHLSSYALIFVAAPILTFIIGRWVDDMLSLPDFPPIPFNLLLGFTVFFLGLAIGIKSTRLLFKIGQGLPWGEFNGQSRSSRLVTTGLYAYCRNPMTLGYSMLPCGMGIMFQSLGMAIFVPTITLASAVIWLKTREEPNMEKRFGDDYREYKRRTPFLIPHNRQLASCLARNMRELRQHGKGREV